MNSFTSVNKTVIVASFAYRNTESHYVQLIKLGMRSEFAINPDNIKFDVITKGMNDIAVVGLFTEAEISKPIPIPHWPTKTMTR